MKKLGKLMLCILLIAVLCGACVIGLAGCDLFSGDSDSNKTPSSVKVTLDLNGGTGVNQTTIIGKPGEPMTLQSPTRQGFTFDKWYNGYDLIDNTVFPKKDMLLTARYYCNEDYIDSTSWESELNKQYGGSSGYYYFTEKNFSADKIKYLLDNPNNIISIKVKLEAICNAAGVSQTFGTQASIAITGASRADTFKQVTFKNYNNYQTYTLNAQTTSARLVGGSNGALLNLVYDTTLGSTYCYFRNIELTISYTITAGSLV